MSEHPTEYGEALIEHMARALLNAERPLSRWESITDEARDWRRFLVRAALTAAIAKLREPSEGMWSAGHGATYRLGKHSSAQNVWRAMLSQLLTEIGI